MTLLITLFALQLAAVVGCALVHHRRQLARQRRNQLPTIGRDPYLTRALHERLSARHPDTDWMSPHSMHAKVAAWLRKN